MEELEMEINDIISFMYENLNGFLATAGSDGKPHVRAFQFMMEDEGKFYFATSNAKDVYIQLRENPFAEYAVSTPDFSKNIRMSGQIHFTEDKSLNEKLLNTYEFLKKIYQTPDNPDFEVFYFQHGKFIYWDFQGNSSAIDF